jgi:serine/threonine protein kinase
MDINSEYKILNKFNGSFGCVILYKYKNYYRIIKKQQIKNSTIKNEANIYIKLKNIKNVPNIYNFYRDELSDYIILDYKGINLNIYKINNYKKQGYIESIKNIISSCIKIIEEIHNNNIIHRDIKPSNICIKNNVPYIIDFGLSKVYIKNSQHIKEKKINNIIGSINYVSYNILKLNEPSRRDDIESFIYVMLYMIISNKEFEIYNNLNIINKKNKNILNVFIKKYINNIEFVKLFDYIKSIKFNIKPNYVYINNIISLL